MRFMQRAGRIEGDADQLEEEDDSEGDDDSEEVGAADEDDHSN